MPVVAVTSVLAAGLLPMFVAETAPATTSAAAKTWAGAYVAYVTAGGITGGQAKEDAFATALEAAFNPALGGAGPALFMSALGTFWIGLQVPAQTGVVTAFLPPSMSIDSPQPDDATPQQQANGLAQVISGLTLGAVQVTIPGPAITPLL